LALIHRCDVSGKDGFKAPFFVLVMQQDDWRDVQRFPAIAAARHFTLQILEESIGEMIERPVVAG
jgi:hypothetical protein